MKSALRPIDAIHVVPGIVEEASGPSYVVMRLCESLLARGDQVRLATLDWGALSAPISFATQYSRWNVPRRLGISPAMREALENAAKSADIIHSHGMWMMPNVYPGWAVRGTQCRLMVSPHGTLSRWALDRSKWAKRVFWTLCQFPAIRDVACMHATSDSEYEDIRRAGFGWQPICVIPSGVDLPDLSMSRTSLRRTLLYFGRIHPVKGIDLLLRAWRVVAPKFLDWDLRIVGSDRGWGFDGAEYHRKMMELAGELGLERVVFCRPLYGSEKQCAYQEADLFVLPTHSENFGVTVAESLAAGTPAIVTKGAPWAGLVRIGAGWWIDIGVDPLVAGLEVAMSKSREELERRGQAGRAWMAEEFSWAMIAAKMDSVYRWIVHGGERPDCVRLT